MILSHLPDHTECWESPLTERAVCDVTMSVVFSGLLRMWHKASSGVRANATYLRSCVKTQCITKCNEDGVQVPVTATWSQSNVSHCC